MSFFSRFADLFRIVDAASTLSAQVKEIREHQAKMEREIESIHDMMLLICPAYREAEKSKR